MFASFHTFTMAHVGHRVNDVTRDTCTRKTGLKYFPWNNISGLLSQTSFPFLWNDYTLHGFEYINYFMFKKRVQNFC